MDSYASAFSDDAEWYSVGSAAAAFPASTSTTHGNNVQLCLYRSFVDGCTDLPCFSFSDTDVAIAVADCDYGSESSPFAGARRFLVKSCSPDLFMVLPLYRVNYLL